MHSTRARGHEVTFKHPAPDHETGLKPESGDGPYFFLLPPPHCRDAYFQLADPRLIEAASDLDPLLKRERNPSGLLTVSEGRIADGYCRRGKVTHNRHHGLYILRSFGFSILPVGLRGTGPKKIFLGLLYRGNSSQKVLRACSESSRPGFTWTTAAATSPRR